MTDKTLELAKEAGLDEFIYQELREKGQ